jgi:hypothetical protein
MPELLETSDFLRFRFISLNGPEAENKGMALFPRKINGDYAMISRQDNENIFLMRSDNAHFWNERKLLLKPEFPWELVQIGNCGPPIETKAGWLVLSHGVGAMRQYCIGAFLLDLEQPSKVLGRLREPILTPVPASAKAMCPMWFIPAAPCCTRASSSSLWTRRFSHRLRQRCPGRCTGGNVLTDCASIPSWTDPAT